MARWQPLKKDVLEALAGEITHNYREGRVIVAVDGDRTSGTAAFADDLGVALGLVGRKTYRASIENFHSAKAEQDAADTAEGYYDSAYNYSLLQRVLVDPFRSGGSTGFVLAAFDEARDTGFQSKWMTAGADAILIVDGVFLQRPQLAGLWNYTVWVDVPETGPEDVRAEADALYLRAVGPRAKATAIIDNRDPEHPRRSFADSC
jgi:uridine kinase